MDAFEQEIDDALRQHMSLARAGIGRHPGGDVRVGDLDVVLAAPGGSPSLIVFSRVGVTTATSCGTSSDATGPYKFSDAATSSNFWTAAATNPVPPGTYRTTGGGGAGQTNPPPVTSLVAAFGGLTAAQINGAWTLTFRDAGLGDTGTVSAATLSLTGGGSFDTDRDNWSLTFGAAYGTALMWQPTGGNPGAGDCDV